VENTAVSVFLRVRHGLSVVLSNIRDAGAAAVMRLRLAPRLSIVLAAASAAALAAVVVFAVQRGTAVNAYVFGFAASAPISLFNPSLCLLLS